MQKTSESIILKRIAFGESDWIVTFFAKNGGKMSGIAKSARASLRRFGGALETGTLVELTYTERRGSDLVRVDEAKVVRPINGIMKTLERIDSMTRALELAISFLQEHERALEKFEFLNKRLEFLNLQNPSPLDVLFYELGWLKLCGFGPHVSNCVLCGALMSGGNRLSFSFDHGGVVCAMCGTKMTGLLPLERDTAETLHQLGSGEIPRNRNSIKKVLNIFGGYTNHILGRSTRTDNASSVTRDTLCML